MEAPKVIDAIPGVAEVRAGLDIAKAVGRHPIRTMAPIIGMAVLAEMTLGFCDPNVHITNQDTLTADSQGHGQVIDLQLHLKKTELEAFDTVVEGAKTSLGHRTDVAIGSKSINFPAGRDALEWGGLTNIIFKVDPTNVKVFFDPGKSNSKADDLIVVDVPLDALSVSPSVVPDFTHKQTIVPTSDLLLAARNILANAGETVTAFKAIPGIDISADQKNEALSDMLIFTQVNTLNNVAKYCSPLVASQPQVWDAMHVDLLPVGREALAEKPDLLSKYGSTKMVVRIGAEDAQHPSIPGQAINTSNVFGDQLDKVKNLKIKSPGTLASLGIPTVTTVNFDSNGGSPAADGTVKDGQFTCEISDTVKQLLNNTPSDTSPSSVGN